MRGDKDKDKDKDKDRAEGERQPPTVRQRIVYTVRFVCNF